ncbi:hypothetical protein [Streptomyces sp. NPDC020817]|uniref:hypothetical protein n=1 Tax=Streptomyces sp. NPDC020817 TaxID=3365095 RepID=UPI0037B4E5DD
MDQQTNQDKGSETADTWQPPRAAYRCEYARRHVGIKAKYGLFVTPPEKAPLSGVRATCARPPVPGPRT